MKRNCYQNEVIFPKLLLINKHKYSCRAGILVVRRQSYLMSGNYVGKRGVNNAKSRRNHFACMFKFNVILHFAIPQAIRFTQLKHESKIDRTGTTDL
jgi:hypothetical protein